MDARKIIGLLPPYSDVWVTVDKKQTVRSIMREVINAHNEFAQHYDRFFYLFDAKSVKGICDNLYSFCKKNIRYKEESDEDQTTAIPAGILTRGYGDCKHYASFCGGVLGAMNRAGKNINWAYRFASYRMTDPMPHHVFIVVFNGDSEIWIDPTPNVEGKEPCWIEDRKIKKDMLRRNIAGVDDATDSYPDINSISEQDLIDALQEVDTTIDLPVDEQQAIVNLLNYGLVTEAGDIIPGRIEQLKVELAPSDYDIIAQAYNKYLEKAQVSGFFSDLWNGVKKVTLSVPRNAFLGLVALNVFGYASKIKKAFENPNSKEQIKKKWESIGGKMSALEGAVNSGAKKKAILSGTGNTVGAVAAAAPAWLTLAAGIIAAIMPLVTKLLQQNNQYDQFAIMDQNIPGQYQGYGTGNGIGDFVRNNPLLIGGAALLLLYYFMGDD